MTEHPIDLDALEETARAATPGEWEVYSDTNAEMIVCEVGRRGFGAISNPATGRADYGKANAEHIATFDPPTVLALIERLRAAEAKVAELNHVLSWDVTCTGCARLLDRCYAADARAEKLKARGMALAVEWERVSLGSDRYCAAELRVVLATPTDESGQ